MAAGNTGIIYADAVCKYTGKDIMRWKPDVIVPVPLTGRKQSMRGFNQSAYLADRVGEQLQIPVAYGLVKKIRNTKIPEKAECSSEKAKSCRCFPRRGKYPHIFFMTGFWRPETAIVTAPDCVPV